MITLIASVILVCSLIGMGIIAFGKIPILVELSVSQEPIKKEKIISWLKKKVEDREFLKDFSYETFLHKSLFKIKILVLKTENKISTLLQKLKEKQQKRKIVGEDNYWEEIKKSTTEFSSMKTKEKKRTNSFSPKEK